ncbi:hypothetical protein NM688_g3057 [Phlebia brevispora]|uniref:Uncharacterized protein n=1 Tax=Phlebia brevispora TaxID=194682 RepID=A0ACC1T6K0_9APHY|nr:hypothetical protein NM688_g3057 [Phlebia brevispora]
MPAIRFTCLADVYISVVWRNIRKMSATAEDAELIEAYKTNLIYGYCNTATLVIVCYEFMLTFREEYELVWKRRWTGATWLFLTNRCDNYSLQHFLTVLGNSPGIIIAVFSALDVFALLGRTYILAAFTFALGIAPVALDFYQISSLEWSYIDDPVLGAACYYNYQISPSVVFHSKKYSDCTMAMLMRLIATLARVFTTIATAVIAIMITWIKTRRHVREASSVGTKVGFGATLLRYGRMPKLLVEFAAHKCETGSLYFTVLFITELLCGFSEFTLSPLLFGALTVCTAILPNIVLSRLLINLRQVHAPESSNGAQPPRFRMLSIASIVGNLGELLADNEDDVDYEDHDIADICKDGAVVTSGEVSRMSDVVDIGAPETEEIPTVSD